MNNPSNGTTQHDCIVNVGLFRSGTTTLTEAASNLGLKAYRKFPELSQEQLKDFLHAPEETVSRWFQNDGGLEALLELVSKYHFICDGWVALLPFLPPNLLQRLKVDAGTRGVNLEFIASQRDVEGTVKSELQHWTVHDLEREAGLTGEERTRLEEDLTRRAERHKNRVESLRKIGFLRILPLSENLPKTWSQPLAEITNLSIDEWSKSFKKIGKCNYNTKLPVEGILLTLRLGTGEEAEARIANVEQMFDQIEQDSLCQYLIVLGIDTDEVGGDAAKELIRRLQSRDAPLSHHLVTNPATSCQPFALCSIWNQMAVVAWKEGADWVVLLGDDINVDCSFHYRAFYRSFLDIAERLKVEFFGCPWWNDVSFPGFPSFPCVGRTHFKIFGELIPEHRQQTFVNQDLDPYLQHLYLKFDAAPCVTDAVLSNKIGGTIGSGDARYKRIPAEGWKDFVLDDVARIRSELPEGTVETLLLDVIVPSYRVKLDYLQSICSLKVPQGIHAHFIVIVDNPEALIRVAQAWQNKKGVLVTRDEAERILERYLVEKGGNNVRVRCNEKNVGASASRNRGLEESAAEFVLHLDDDLVPNPDLLEQYAKKLFQINETVVGLVGLVRFPRSSTLPLRHAAVLMSYLTFMFEIAERDMYESPAWGVTANILFRRTKVRFDLAYAKTGGGEDVDYSLRVRGTCNGGRLLAVPDACVVHPFWPGSVFALAKHFYSWAIGDGALFKRFPEHTYWSFPNVPETLLLASPLSLWVGSTYFMLVLPFLASDFAVDYWNPDERKHRRLLLQTPEDPLAERSELFYFSAQVLANLYVVVLECGRLRGHIGRMDIAQGMLRRFDWHIGRLENAPSNFRMRESRKFCLFVLVLAVFVKLYCC